jgi:drug/metabolite transporter (DMT)-like permease
MAAFLGSLKLTTVAHVAIIYATIPFVLAVLAYWIMGERTSPATLIASGVAGAGVIANGVGEGTVVGDALAAAMTPCSWRP